MPAIDKQRQFMQQGAGQAAALLRALGDGLPPAR